MTLSLLSASILSLPGKLLTTVAGAPVKAAAQVGLDAVSSWIVAGAEAMLREVVKVIATVTTPSLSVSWFSSSYWQMAALAMLLTLPFLFAAAVQAVIQTNVAILVRAAFVDLPVAAISVTLAAPLITLLLAATDQMCSLVGGGGSVGGSFLTRTATQLSGAGNGFMLVVIAVVILLAGMVLLVELIMRSAAIYIVVLFLPIGFAAMVWPARRVWVKRMLETLIALILSKFAMVAILSMSVAALASLSTSPSALTTAFTAMALTVLAAFSPWALLRLLPFTELAVSATSTLRQEAHGGMGRGIGHAATAADLGAGLLVDPVMEGIGGLRNFVSANAEGTGPVGPGRLSRGGGDMLAPGSDRSAGSEPGGAPAVGPDTGGGGGGSASILPPESGDAVTAVAAAGLAGAGVAAMTDSSSASTPPTATGASGPSSGADAGSGPGARPAPAANPSGAELGSLSGPDAGTGGPPPPSGFPAGGELRRGAGVGGEMPTTGDAADAVGGPVDGQAPIFGLSDGRVNLARIEADWIVGSDEAVSSDEDPPGSSDA